jgi:TRAP-type mannitol/chloroaromatic compound transport system substrate-binding protein
MLAKAQGPIALRCQTAWPAKHPFHRHALDLAKRINDMAGGDLRLEFQPAGTGVGAIGLLDSVSKGTLDGSHGALSHHYHKQDAFGLWGSGPAFGMNAEQLLAWHRYGGGKDLLARLYGAVEANVVSYLYGPMPTQPLGWFRKAVTRAADFKGLRFRTVGPSVELFAGMGALVNPLPEDQIVAAMERALIDGAEASNASADRALGLPDVAKVCMLQSYHQNAEQFEVLFNKDRFAALPAKLKALLENAIEAASQDMAWKAVDHCSRDYAEMIAKDRVRFLATPAPVLQRQLESYDELLAKRSGNALFGEILESQRQYARRVVSWDLATNVDRRMAFNHYFGGKTGRKKR